MSSIASIRDELIRRVAAALGVTAGDVALDEPLSRLGLDSARAVDVTAGLAAHLGRALPATLLWEYPTIAALAGYLAAPDGARAAGAAARTIDEPVAIIGLGCRLPGAPDPEAFWRLLCEGGDAITEVPTGRWDVDATADPAGKSPRWGGFLDAIDRFDPQFFGIAPREAADLDPQQRLALEVAWEALEDAGLAPGRLRATATGVFVGAMWTDYGTLHAGELEATTAHTATGQDASIIAARISYSLGLEGPSLTVNTACSSSLVAIHLACQSLRSGDASLAIAGGVNLMIVPDSTVAMARFGGLSADGRCFTFDARANGYVRGEGAGMVVLKPLSRARADGDRVYGVIRGSAVNNDGASNGLTAPNPRAQEAVLRAACARAGVAPTEVRYVEAHGTGTQLGDPIEVRALGAVLGAGRPATRPLVIGSVKTNIGHLESAAGVASLIKVALCLRHGALPPSLHVQTLNPHIAFDALGVRVQTALGPWPDGDGPIIAGVSAFGFGGTNCHVVVQAWPAAQVGADRAAQVAADGAVHDAARPVFVFSGQGSQWPAMGHGLWDEPVFRAVLARCDARFAPFAGASLFELTAELLARARVAWPAIVALEMALAAQWRAWGVEPGAVVGHSIGEVAAAQCAGALSIDEAMDVICAQAARIDRLHGDGAMALIGVGWEAARRRLADTPELALAIHASPDSTVVVGDPAAIDRLCDALAAEQISCRRIAGEVPAHSPRLTALAGELADALAALRPGRTTVPLVSTVTGAWHDGEALDAAYWARGFASPVLLAPAVRCLADAGYRAFVEIAPHPVVQRSIEATLAHHGVPGLVLASLRRGEPDRAALREALGTLSTHGHRVTRVDANDPHVLAISARSAPALVALARAYRTRLDAADDRLGDVAYSAGVHRDHHAHRLAIAGRTHAAICERLDGFLAGEPAATGQVPPGGAPRLAFVFSGQGAQWVGMARQLMASEAVFRRAIERCDRLLAVHAGWSLCEALAADEASSRLADTEVAQPALFAIQVALCALLASWGIRPDAVIGHSIGEVTAAHVAGALSLEAAIELVHHRARVMQRATGAGAMVWVAQSAAQIARWLAGDEARLGIAAINDPASVVVSGERTAIAALVARLEAARVAVRPLRVSYAFHSPQMAPLADELAERVRGLAPGATTAQLYSTVTGGALDGGALDAAHWRRNVRDPVRFADAVAAALADGPTTFLELGPHPVLTVNVAQCIAASGAPGAALATLRRDGDEPLCVREALAGLYARGHQLDFARLAALDARRVDLPRYPWQRERYWRAATGARRPGGHPLLGTALAVAALPGARCWDHTLAIATLPYLADHRVGGAVVVPGAAYVEIALAAAAQAFPDTAYALEAVAFEQLLALPADEAYAIQTAITAIDPAGGPLAIYGRRGAAAAWTRHASATIRVIDAAGDADRQPRAALTSHADREPPAVLRARLASHATGEVCYRRLAERGLDYGPAFQGVREAWSNAGEVLARIAHPDGAAPAAYQLHPALLDAGLQAVMLAFAANAEDGTWIPVGADRIVMRHRPADALWAHVRVRPGEPRADLALLDDAGGVMVEVIGVRVQRLDGASARPPGEAWLHVLGWTPQPARDLSTTPRTAPRGAWLVLEDRHRVGAELRELLEARGARVVRVWRGAKNGRREPGLYEADGASADAFHAILKDAFGGDTPCLGIVHLWSLDGEPDGAIADATRLGVLSALHLAQAVLHQGWRDVPRLWSVTRSAIAIGGGAIAVAQAPLWGLARTVTLEHPELAWTRIDLAAARGSGEARALLAELDARDGEAQVALRPDGRHVARLRRATFDDAPPAQIRPDATYLITGGLGGLGLALARWLADKGARHLALLGRSAPDDAAHATLEALRAAGTTVRVSRADVAQRAELAAALAEIDREMPPLAGVIHAAGVLADRTVLALDARQVERAMAPKALGAWHLHELTRDRPLDAFVMYSSVVAVLGSPGQASYAAANAFLDALAHERRRLGLPALSVNWGPFSEVGMAAAEAQRGQRLATHGLASVTPAQGLAMLDRLWSGRAAQMTVVPLDVRQWLELHVAADGPLWSELARGEARTADGADQRRATLGALGPAQRRDAVERYLVDQLAKVLQLAVDRIDRGKTMGELGLDSLMSLELRNRLEAGVGIALSPTVLFTYPTITALAAHVLGSLALPEAAPATVAASPTFADHVAEMSDAEAERLLLESLE